MSHIRHFSIRSSWMTRTYLPRRVREIALLELLESRRLLSFSATFPGGVSLIPRDDVDASLASLAGLGHENEVTIVVNPTNPRNVVAFAIDQDPGGGTQDGIDKAWYSFDGGLNYEQSDIPNPDALFGAGDPAAAFDRQGNLYYAHLTGPGLSVSVAKSTNGGASWATTVVAATATAGSTDKCWITVGPNPTDMNQDIIYVGYSRFVGTRQVRCVRSLDCGATFTDDVLVSDPGAGDSAFARPVVNARNGRVYMLWNSGGTILIDSAIGGVGWGNDHVVAGDGIQPPYRIPASPGFTIQTVPSLAIDPIGPNPDQVRLLVAYTTSPGQGDPNTDISVASRDASMLNPLGIGPWAFTTPHSPSAQSQFHPWIDADPMTGVPYVSWLDCRNDPNNKKVERFTTASIDGGATWLPETKVSDGATDQSVDNPNATLAPYKEYTANWAFAGMVYDAWADSSNSQGNADDPPKLDVYTDRTILTGHVITVTGTADPDTYHVQMDASGEFLKIWENTSPIGTPTFTMHRDALSGLIFNLDTGADVIYVAPAVLDYLTASPDKFLDAGDSYMIVDYAGASPITSLQSLLRIGYNDGTWDGNGIRSSTAAAAANTALGFVEATDLFSEFPATFAGQLVDDTSVLVKYTFYGDTDLNGNVNLTDFNRLAANFGLTGRRWVHGDFNYDTNVNLVDFNLLAANFGESGLGPGGGGGTYGYTVHDLLYHLMHGGHGLTP